MEQVALRGAIGFLSCTDPAISGYRRQAFVSLRKEHGIGLAGLKGM